MRNFLFILVFLCFPVAIGYMASPEKTFDEACMSASGYHTSSLSYIWKGKYPSIQGYLKDDTTLYFIVTAYSSLEKKNTVDTPSTVSGEKVLRSKYDESRLYSYSCIKKTKKLLNLTKKNDIIIPTLSKKVGNYLVYTLPMTGSCLGRPQDKIYSLISQKTLPDASIFSSYPVSPKEGTTGCETYGRLTSYEYLSPGKFSFFYGPYGKTGVAFIADFASQKVYKK